MVKTKNTANKPCMAMIMLKKSLFSEHSVLAPLNIFMIYVRGWFSKVINHAMTILVSSITVFMVDYFL